MHQCTVPTFSIANFREWGALPIITLNGKQEVSINKIIVMSGFWNVKFMVTLL